MFVNPSRSVLMNQYANLLTIPMVAKPMKMGEWLDLHK